MRGTVGNSERSCGNGNKRCKNGCFDDTATNKAICEYMRSAGHTALAAFGGEQGLEIAGERSVDLVVEKPQ